MGIFIPFLLGQTWYQQVKPSVTPTNANADNPQIAKWEQKELNGFWLPFNKQNNYKSASERHKSLLYGRIGYNKDFRKYTPSELRFNKLSMTDYHREKKHSFPTQLASQSAKQKHLALIQGTDPSQFFH